MSQILEPPKTPMPPHQSLSIGKVERKPLAIQTANLLRHNIVTGKLLPGTRLIEIDVAKDLGISRGILREALRMLEQENLLESIPGRGTYVAGISQTDIQEIYSLRRILEAEAVRLAVRKVTDQDIAQLQAILDEMFTQARLDNKPAVVEKDLEFHQKIWEICGHNRIKNVLDEMKSLVRAYLAVNIDLYEDLATDIADHQLILDAIRQKDEDKASGLLAEHISDAAELITRSMLKSTA